MRNKLLLLILAPVIISCAPIKTSTYYDSIIIDLVYTEISQPDSNSLTLFRSKLEQYNITKNIIITTRKVKLPIELLVIPWNMGYLTTFERQNRILYDTNPLDRRLVLFIAYIPGIFTYTDTDNICGLKYDRTSFAIFTYLAGEEHTSVLLHELLHIIGLVDPEVRNEPPTNPNRPGHCNNCYCNMFWKVGSEQHYLCRKCLRELQDLIRDL